jgi:hypothetical protein
MGWRLKPESDERALIAALRALVEAEASQDRGHTADRKRGGYSRPHDILWWPSHRHGNIEPTINPSPREARMLAEIFMLRLEATAGAAKEAATITRSTSPFVPVTLPVPTPKAA